MNADYQQITEREWVFMPFMRLLLLLKMVFNALCQANMFQ